MNFWENTLKDPGTGPGKTIVLGLQHTFTMFGGPANTSYSENTGVLALTQKFNPTIMRIAAVILVLGIGRVVVPLSIGSEHYDMGIGMALAAVVGIILNQILPGKDAYVKQGDE
jgi:xanthine/uracil permease